MRLNIDIQIPNMNALRRGRGAGTGNSGASVGTQQNNQTSQRRTTLETTRNISKLTEPQSAHCTGARRTSGEGAGGDGRTADWKSPVSFGCSGRKLGGAGAGSGNGNYGNGNRLGQPTIASSQKIANKCTAVKQLRDKAGTPANLTQLRQDKAGNINKPRSIKWDISADRKRVHTDLGYSIDDKRAKTSVNVSTSKQNSGSRKTGGGVGGLGIKKSGPVFGNKDAKISVINSAGDAGLDKVATESLDKVSPPVQLMEIGIQTNEPEILNHGLVIGNIKLLVPTRELVDQIEKSRMESKAKLVKKTTRKFSKHEQEEEMHLDELKEFSERNCVTKRDTNKKSFVSYANYEQTHYNNIFKSMDDFFSREVPKSESLSNITDRIKRKEQELMSLFNEVELNERPEYEF